MINREQKTRLISGVLKLIPEYDGFKKKKENLKNKYLAYLRDTYLTPLDKKNREYWVETTEIEVINKSLSLTSELYVLYDLWREIYCAYNIKFPNPQPYVVKCMTDLKDVDTEFWEYLKEDIQDYIKTVSILVKKINKFGSLLENNKLTITCIKINFPELYEKYKSLSK